MNAPNRPETWGLPLYKSIARAPLTPSDFEFEPNSWHRPTSKFLAPLETLVEQAIENADQHVLDAVHAMIEQLDAMDGDPDLEPCPAGDDGCHYFILGGKEGWGYNCDESDGPVPAYGDDQSEGPLDSLGRSSPGYEARAWRG